MCQLYLLEAVLNLNNWTIQVVMWRQFMSKKTRRAGGDKRKSSSQSAWRNHCLLLWLYPSHSQIIDSRISHVLQADLYHAEAIFFYCFCFRKHSESNARGSETKYQLSEKVRWGLIDILYALWHLSSGNKEACFTDNRWLWLLVIKQAHDERNRSIVVVNTMKSITKTRTVQCDS